MMEVTSYDENMSKAETGTSSASFKDAVLDEPEASPLSDPSKPWWKSAATKWAVGALLVAGAIVTAISVPLVHKNRDESSTPTVNYVPPFEEDEIPILSQDVLAGYESVEEFKLKFTEVAKSYLNGVIGGQLGATGYTRFGVVDRANDQFVQETAAQDGDVRASDPTTAVGNKLDDFETNNQESGVNEGDVVVTNGKVAFAAYGQYIVGWNVTSGTSLLKMKLEGPTAGVNDYYGHPRIHTLLLMENSLIVAAGNFNGYQSDRVLSGFDGTRILVYNLASIGVDKSNLDLIAQRDINGYFVSLRAIGESIHFVTNTELNWYNFMYSPFQRYNNALADLEDANYTEEVRRIATTKAIPEFVQQTTDELLECGVLPRIVRLNRWTTDDNSDPKMEHFLYNQGYARSMVLISSFNVTKVETEGQGALECISMAGSFFPSASWSTQIYSAKDTMIMAVQGFDYSASRKKSIDSTYLVAYGLDGASAAPKSLGHVDGYVLGQYSFRVEGSVLEIATTVRDQWMWIMAERLDRRLQVNVPTTENWIMTMDLNGANGTIQELDRLKLGKEGEVFTTVRFYNNKDTSENKAYAVTFRQMDPFYVVNTTDANNIEITGILDNITGWSSYLEPMDDDNSVMLALGQEANEFGAPVGVSISVFDARDLDSVQIADRLLLESNENVWSDSEGLREKNAVRFNPETGLLILPLRLSSYDGAFFRGFKVFVATVDSVVERKGCEVDHTGKFDQYYSYADASLEPRALIVAGSYMSTMGNEIVMTDLDSCAVDWRLTL